MRLNVALTAFALAFALTGSTARGQGPTSVFTPAPQGGAVPGVQGPGAVPPRDRARTSAKGTASIRGRVTAAGTTTPLRRAQVAVFSAEGPARFTTTTNGEGRFEVLELPAGRYSITVNKGGYVSLQYGQRRPFEPGTPVAVADGQALTGMDMALPRGSVIAGRITDEFGEPVAQAQVSAQRYQYMQDGQRRLTPTGTATTDDLGQFRLHSLMPGEYIVSATFRSNFVTVGPFGGSDTSESFLPTFHPGTINASEAQPVTVALGQESAVQFALSAAKMARVSGVVVDSTGRPVSSAMVVMLPSSGFGVVGGLATSQTGADGSFLFANVAPGDYVANVQMVPGLSGANIAEAAAVPVSVGGSDLHGLRIATGPGILMSGHVEFEGTSSRTAPTPWRVITQSLTPAQVIFSVGAGSPQANGLVGDDGSFQLQVSGAGSALVRITTTPSWTLKSVTLDGDDITDSPLDFSGKAAVSGVRIVLTDKLTTVSGRVVERGKPLTDYAVIIQPEESKSGAVATRYLRVLRPDQNGGFRVTGLPPGRYAATAVETFEQGRQFVPDVQARLKARGRTFSIDEGGTAALDLSLVTGVE